tara:strand:+ start:7516 stop:8331 length:816 start_codon:yes stop_codon:yes gene_type:complete
MPKHNKKRNTAFLYEALVREVVRQSLNKNTEIRNKVVCALKEHFSIESEIGKELRLFKILLETKGTSTRIGEKLIQETKKEYKKLNEKKIFVEQSALIKKINKEISSAVFSNFVPNYKDLATLSQIFGEEVSVKKRVMLEEKVLASLSLKRQSKIKNDKLNNLVINKFVERFNKQYNNKLLESQKSLLNKYILSFLDNGVDLKVYLNEELQRLKDVLSESFGIDELKNDNKMTEKMKKVQHALESFSGAPLNRETIEGVLKVQLVAKEVQS